MRKGQFCYEGDSDQDEPVALTALAEGVETLGFGLWFRGEWWRRPNEAVQVLLERAVTGRIPLAGQGENVVHPDVPERERCALLGIGLAKRLRGMKLPRDDVVRVRGLLERVAQSDDLRAPVTTCAVAVQESEESLSFDLITEFELRLLSVAGLDWLDESLRHFGLLAKRSHPQPESLKRAIGQAAKWALCSLPDTETEGWILYGRLRREGLYLLAQCCTEIACDTEGDPTLRNAGALAVAGIHEITEPASANRTLCQTPLEKCETSVPELDPVVRKLVLGVTRGTRCCTVKAEAFLEDFWAAVDALETSDRASAPEREAQESPTQEPVANYVANLSGETEESAMVEDAEPVIPERPLRLWRLLARLAQEHKPFPSYRAIQVKCGFTNDTQVSDAKKWLKQHGVFARDPVNTTNRSWSLLLPPPAKGRED